MSSRRDSIARDGAKQNGPINQSLDEIGDYSLLRLLCIREDAGFERYG